MNGTLSEAQDNHLHKHETPGFNPGSFHIDALIIVQLSLRAALAAWQSQPLMRLLRRPAKPDSSHDTGIEIATILSLHIKIYE
jgi:hypothetical protein